MVPSDDPRDRDRDDAPTDPEADDGDDREPAERTVRKRLEALIPDLVKRTVSAGLGAVLTTEEGIRKLATDFSLPKDVAAYLLSTAQSTKDEVMKIFAREVREFLQGLNLNQELAKLLTSLSFEIKTEIRFIPNDEAVSGVKSDIKRKVSLKRGKKDGTTEPIEDERDPKPKS